MKKLLSGLSVFLLCMMLFIPIALADDVKVMVTAEPTELVDGGDVTFTFEISNNSIYELHDITIQYLGTVYDVMETYQLSPIPIGGSASNIALTLPVSESQLGQPLTFTVAWLQGGEPFSQQVQYTIARAANPVISVTRSVSTNMAKQGDVITITYELKNETKFDMTDIVLIDEQISDNPILRMDVLKSSGTSTMTHQYKMGSADVVSAPVVTYTVNGKSKVFSSIEPVTLSMMLIELTMSIDAGTPTAAGVTFTLELKNTGNQEIRNIQITDERDNPVNGSVFSLKAGDSVTYPYLVVPVMTEPVRNVSFKLTGRDPFDAPYELSSAKTYEVYPFVDESQIKVSARAETVTPWASGTGTLTARIVIQNYSTVELKNIIVNEASIGVIKSIDLLPAGEYSFEQELLVGSPRNLQLTITGVDPTGTTRSLASCLLPVAYSAEATVGPEATSQPAAESPRIFASVSSTISKILLGLGALMVLAFIVLVVLSILERSRGDRVHFDDEDEDADELDQFFDDEPEPEEPEPESDAAYFTNRIGKIDRAYAARGSARPPSIALPAGKDDRNAPVFIELDDEYSHVERSPVDQAAVSNEILNEIERNTAQIFESQQVRTPQEPLTAFEAEDAPLDPAELPIPKVLTGRSAAVVRPASHKTIKHVRKD